MSSRGWIFGLLCLLIAVLIVLYDRRKTRKTMELIERMLGEAMEGTFTEETFDESRMSALETKFAQYLSASAISARNVSVEKDRIKTLISDISHQTKTPVSNLLLYSELLKEEELPESARSNVNALHAQTEKLRFLIDSLVKMSRLESGILTLAPRRESVQTMLNAVQEQFAPDAERKGLYLKLEETDAYACFDPKWTTEAICNLVDNAVKYTRTGGITISIDSYEMFVRIDIADTGMGIAEEEQAKIFQRFYRSERAHDQEGVGIGLYLAREILSGQGGYIKVASKPGEGSVFSVFLPRG